MRQKWQEKVREVDFVKKKNNYTIRQVAEHLDLSIGKVCEDLKLCAALRVYPRLEEMKSYTEALEYVRAKGFERMEE